MDPIVYKKWLILKKQSDKLKGELPFSKTASMTHDIETRLCQLYTEMKRLSSSSKCLNSQANLRLIDTHPHLRLIKKND